MTLRSTLLPPTLLSLSLLFTACGPGGALGGGEGGFAAPEVVLTISTSGSGTPDPNNVYEVAVTNLDGSGFRQLTSDGKQKFLPHFSPDGSKLLYTKYTVGGYGGPSSKTVFAVYDLATGQETVIADGGTAAIAQTSWSPDGRRIATIELGVPHSANQPPGSPLTIMNADGSNPVTVGGPSGASDDLYWADIAWSSQDWILFVVGQDTNGCNKSRIDKIRPDGSSRIQVSDGGPNCTPPDSLNPYGDADPGWGADGSTIFSSRGLPSPASLPGLRHIFAFSSDAWAPGKPETDLQASEPSCAGAVPKGSPDGKRLLTTRNCASDPSKYGVYVADVSAAAASNWRLVALATFGSDWNPGARR